MTKTEQFLKWLEFKEDIDRRLEIIIDIKNSHFRPAGSRPDKWHLTEWEYISHEGILELRLEEYLYEDTDVCFIKINLEDFYFVETTFSNNWDEEITFAEYENGLERYKRFWEAYWTEKWKEHFEAENLKKQRELQLENEKEKQRKLALLKKLKEEFPDQ